MSKFFYTTGGAIALGAVLRRGAPLGFAYTAGPLLRASINGTGGPLSYDAAHHRWQTYCAAVGVEIDIHQLRHAHATELINAGVSTETIQLYALLDDKIADAEIRAARRHRDQTARHT
ncbi:tyrosine-type recombinase/integrase [Streptosporangium sp. CA-115845]|uniref:tyrosine-type recombinase/integrase n=1 Tax=Streptosporangium sp. CA-115845 TaxID=3240071 RepID=UPI003D8D6757